MRIHRTLGVPSLVLAWAAGCVTSSDARVDGHVEGGNDFIATVKSEQVGAGELRAEALEKGLDALENVDVPEPSNLYDVVADKDAAIVLGKALFWDMQVGSDGQACASCHSHAGADGRRRNQLAPNLISVTDPTRDPDPDVTFGDADGKMGSGDDADPNDRLVADDYPFHRLEDPEDRESCVDGEDDDGDGLVDFADDDCFDTNDATSSQGTFAGEFERVASLRHAYSLPRDRCGDADDPIFQVRGIAVRKVEPRNTPTMINAVFNHRNFWDGRANNIFNGLNPLGERGLQPTPDNLNPGTLVRQVNGSVAKVQLRLDNASLASQAVGPPLSDFEMSCAGRTFADIGHKLRKATPLAFQHIAHDDSVLGRFRQDSGEGLEDSYSDLIKEAFRSEYWAGSGRFDADGDPVSSGGYTQMEVNFSLFFGVAVQLYEATLVSDETDFDAFIKGDDSSLDGVEQFGLQLFLNEGRCINCHNGAEFTGASVQLRANQPDGNEESIERMVMGDNGVALYDGGFYNIGVRPTFEDLGVGGELRGFPLSFARQITTANKLIDDFNFDPARFEVDQPDTIVEGERVAVDGAFKVPGLRNAELTGPYFHNGGQATLSQVVEFYDRGGDRLSVDGNGDDCDTTGFAENCSNLDPDIEPIGLDELTRDIDGTVVSGEDALVAFLLTLTDHRVRKEAEPFDHPQLFIPKGALGHSKRVTNDGTGRAIDNLTEVDAVGENGDDELDTFLRLTP